MALEEYKRKRNFRRTPEPAGRVRYERGQPSLEFVIQKHDASHLHYDFRLELDGVLKSWAVPKGPSLKPGVKRLAMHVEDHPMDYGGFEGIIPAGQYGGGTVMLWDRGTWIPDGDPVEGYRRGRLKFRLDGEKLHGSWNLVRMQPKPGDRKESWLLMKEDDEAARTGGEADITEDSPLSVATGRDLEEIAGEADAVWNSDREEGGGVKARAKVKVKVKAKAKAKAKAPLPGGARKARLRGEVRPQLATLEGEAPEGEEWLHELKFDGYRVVCRVEEGEVRIITRNGKDWTDRFEGLVGALAELPCAAALLDGEVVVLDEAGISNFQMLQNSISGAPAGTPLLYAFDLLHLDGYDLTGAPLEERKAALAWLLESAGDPIRYSDHVRGQGRAFFERACGMGVEGIISKRADRPYRQGRGRDWLKTKCTARQEFVVVGYTEPSGSRVGLGALLLGVHDGDGRLIYTGKVGTGFDTRTLVELESRLSTLERADPPVANPLKGARARGVHWVRPETVVEIEFTEWTDDGRIRHPSFRGVREDKEVEEVVREATTAQRTMSRRPVAQRPEPQRAKAQGERRVAGVRISSPDRVLWPEQGVTKAELAEYYEAVADVMLPRLVDRPLTLVRCPSGAGKKCFYQKHANESMPEVVPRVAIEEKDGSEPYMYVDGLPSLIALVQLGVLELHVWGSRRDRLERPDRLVLDLDPDEGLPFGRVAAAALDLRERLRSLGLESFVKTTGGKGLHVVVPITRRSDWDEARAFTEAIARAMVADAPDSFTAKMTKSQRSGRIFVDYLRNGWNATAIADYSTRARPGAPVALPLAWDELSARARRPPVHTIRDVAARLAEVGDTWSGFDDVRQSITAAAKRAVGL